MFVIEFHTVKAGKFEFTTNSGHLELWMVILFRDLFTCFFSLGKFFCCGSTVFLANCRVFEVKCLL